MAETSQDKDFPEMRQAEPLNVTPMTEEEAREIIKQINESISDIRFNLLELHRRRGWEALGYSSWEECVTSSFGQSRGYLFKQLQAAEVEENLHSSSDEEIESEIPTSHLRELARLPLSDQLDGLNKADELASAEGQPRTVHHIKRAVKTIFDEKKELYLERFPEAWRKESEFVLNVVDREIGCLYTIDDYDGENDEVCLNFRLNGFHFKFGFAQENGLEVVLDNHGYDSPQEYIQDKVSAVYSSLREKTPEHGFSIGDYICHIISSGSCKVIDLGVGDLCVKTDLMGWINPAEYLKVSPDDASASEGENLLESQQSEPPQQKESAVSDAVEAEVVAQSIDSSKTESQPEVSEQLSSKDTEVESLRREIEEMRATNQSLLEKIEMMSIELKTRYRIDDLLGEFEKYVSLSRDELRKKLTERDIPHRINGKMRNNLQMIMALVESELKH